MMILSLYQSQAINHMQKLYKIEQPDINKVDIKELIPLLFSDSDVAESLKKTETPEYLHWKDIKYKNWIPEKFKHDKTRFWALTKFHRKLRGQISKISDKNNKVFTWEKLRHYEKVLHEIDLDMSSCLFDFSDISKKDHKKYQMKGILEEAIASSQLEGAHTTRKAAKKMIQENRKPQNYDEQMIYNNFIAMKAIEEKYKNNKLSLELLLDLHVTLTSKTSVPLDKQGKFRLDSDEIVIQKGDDQSLISYIAPPISFVEQEIKKLIDFANDDLEEKDFIHPIIKAIMLHFWIGLLHPFFDGNGRLARGIFYWYLLRKGYWAFAFLPISLVIKSSPAQYGEAYILSEQDDNNLTYFIDYNLRKILQSVENFKEYMKKKTQENEGFKMSVDEVLRKNKSLNQRQVEVLINFNTNSEKRLNVSAYVNLYKVTKATAIKDLKGLLELKFVESERIGKNVFYIPTSKISEIF
jgi:Fic family protein